MMKRLALVVLCTFVAQSVHADTLLDAGLRYAADQAQATSSCVDSRIQGRKDAGDHGTKGWFWGSFGAGIAAGFIGAGAVSVGAAFSNPQPEDVPSTADAGCYRDGYHGRAKSKNVTSAVIGGVVGAAVFTSAVLLACGARDGNLNHCGYYGGR
jgi:hypothetical protein